MHDKIFPPPCFPYSDTCSYRIALSPRQANRDCTALAATPTRGKMDIVLLLWSVPQPLAVGVGNLGKTMILEWGGGQVVAAATPKLQSIRMKIIVLGTWKCK